MPISPPRAVSLFSVLAKHGASLVAKKICEEVAPRLQYRIIRKSDGSPYLQRSYFDPDFRSQPDIGMFLHKFLGDDDVGVVHNHPWVWCVSIILAGSYSETRFRWSTQTLRLSSPPMSSPPEIDSVRLYSKQTRVLSPFDINIINHDDMHRVSLIDKECWTLFIHGPRVSSWGFADMESGKFTSIAEKMQAEERPTQK
jgi:hypothetical protein